MVKLGWPNPKRFHEFHHHTLDDRGNPADTKFNTYIKPELP